jgi:hypothetical protein
MSLSAAELVAGASARSEAIRHARRRHTFESESLAFTRLLASAPDYSPRELGLNAMARLERLAEGVITQIERRVSLNEDSNAVQVRLVECVYDIRRELEEIDRWRRHYFGALAA